MEAPWPTPSFVGDLLPAESSVAGDAFSAGWRSAGFGAPRLWLSGAVGQGALTGSEAAGPTIGVELLDATPVYRMISRVAKYGLLTVALAFATYLFFELLSRLRIHLTQYGLVGLSLALFPLLLLSLAEPIGYQWGYVASAGLVLAQSSLYTAAIARRAAPALIFAALLAGLFGFLYVLLSLETYSLLVGALALFAMLSALMALTQRIERGRDATPASA
jgi:inner membrane protein